MSNETLPLLPSHEKSLFTNFEELKGFIKEELQQTIDTLMQPSLQKKLNSWLQEMKCNCIGNERLALSSENIFSCGNMTFSQ